MIKLNIKLVKVLLLMIFVIPSFAFAGSEVHITSDGKASVSQIKVMQIFSNTLATRMYWGSAFLRLTVKTSNNTKFYRGTGEVTGFSEIVEGNVLDVVGELESGSDSLTMVASSVKNLSVQKQQTVLSGKVTSVDLGIKRLVVDSPAFGIVTINTSTTTVFKKGTRTLDLDHVKVGDTITKVSGEFDYKTKVLTATTVNTYLDMNIFKSKNFDGSIVEVGFTTLPTTMKIKIANTTYEVNLNAKVIVLSKNKKLVGLNRFVVGDLVRLYGFIREVDDPVIDAQIIRNLSL